MKWQELENAPCSIARSLAVVGDRWTLLILRDAFLRVRRFDDFQQRLGITRHLLASRLDKLVKLGVMKKQQYQDRPPRHEYRLTPMGIGLYPVLQVLTAWGDQWLDGGKGPPVVYRHQRCGKTFTPTMHCSECGEPVDPREVTPTLGPGFRAAVTDGKVLSGT